MGVGSTGTGKTDVGVISVLGSGNLVLKMELQVLFIPESSLQPLDECIPSYGADLLAFLQRVHIRMQDRGI